MLKLVKIEPVRTYKTFENAQKAVEKKLAKCEANLRYTVLIHEDGRFFPVFLGVDAIQAGIHFHFNVVG